MKKLTLLFAATVLLCSVTFAQLKITTFNAEWLSCSSYGPSNDDLQMKNVATVIKTMNSDVVALQEVGTSDSYKTIDILVGLLGDEWGGKIIPWSNSNCAQNQGIVYKKSKVTYVSGTLVRDGGSYSAWSSGRFPAEYNITYSTDSGNIPITLINIHAKATSSSSTDPTQDYARRKEASQGLKTLLDGASYCSRNLVVIGDFNDYLNGTQCSSCSASTSPYKNFIDDATHYKALTANLSGIDQIIISDKLFNYVSGNAFKETTATNSVSNYRNTTSDHTPVSATFSFAGYTTTEKNSYSKQILLYPNPVKNTLHVESKANNITAVRVCNLKGTTVYEQNNIDATLFDIATSTWSDGLYVVTVTSDKGEKGSKMIVKN